MAQENNFYWRKLNRNQLDFDSRALMLMALDTIDYSDVEHAFSKLLLENLYALTLMANSTEESNSFDVFKTQSVQRIVSVNAQYKD